MIVCVPLGVSVCVCRCVCANVSHRHRAYVDGRLSVCARVVHRANVYEVLCLRAYVYVVHRLCVCVVQCLLDVYVGGQLCLCACVFLHACVDVCLRQCGSAFLCGNGHDRLCQCVCEFPRVCAFRRDHVCVDVVHRVSVCVVLCHLGVCGGDRLHQCVCESDRQPHVRPAPPSSRDICCARRLRRRTSAACLLGTRSDLQRQEARATCCSESRFKLQKAMF